MLNRVTQMNSAASNAEVVNKPKLNYHPPRLQTYGKVIELAAGGNGSASENSGLDGTKWRPQVSASLPNLFLTLPILGGETQVHP